MFSCSSSAQNSRADILHFFLKKTNRTLLEKLIVIKVLDADLEVAGYGLLFCRCYSVVGLYIRGVGTKIPDIYDH